jgi:hypothetical protein
MSVATNALLYDPRYQTFEAWASLLCEQYAAQNLSIPDSGTDWKAWASGLLAIDVFTNEAAPSPYQFDDWQEWAAALLAAMNS